MMIAGCSPTETRQETTTTTRSTTKTTETTEFAGRLSPLEVGQGVHTTGKIRGYDVDLTISLSNPVTGRNAKRWIEGQSRLNKPPFDKTPVRLDVRIKVDSWAEDNPYRVRPSEFTVYDDTYTSIEYDRIVHDEDMRGEAYSGGEIAGKLPFYVPKDVETVYIQYKDYWWKLSLD